MPLSTTLNATTKSVIIASMLFAGSAFAAPEKPDAFITRISNELIVKLKTVNKTNKSKKAEYVQLISQNIEPYVDFDTFSRSVMGGYYKTATSAQYSTFKTNFKSSLVNNYASYMSEFDNESVKIKPFVPSKDTSKAQVFMDFKTDAGKVVPIKYDLNLVGSGWKVYNVTVQGINVGMSLRNQFDANVKKNKGNLDLAIKTFVPVPEKK